MEKSPSLTDIINKNEEEINRLTKTIIEKESNIKKYQEEIQKLKNIENSRKKQLDKFEKMMRETAENLAQSTSQFDKGNSQASSIFDSEIVNATLAKTGYERELMSFRKRASKMKKDFEKVIEGINKSTNELNEIKQKRNKIMETLLEDEQLRTTFNEMNNQEDILDKAKYETKQTIMKLYSQMIEMIQRKIQSEIEIEKQVREKYEQEMNNLEVEELDTFELDLLKKRIQEKEQKGNAFDKELATINELKANETIKITEKEKELAAEKENIRKAKKRIDSINDIIVCPCYTATLAKTIAETRANITRVNNKQEKKETQKMIMDNEIKEMRKTLKLLERGIGKEEENRLILLSETNKADTELIYIKADEEVEERTFSTNAKILDRILRRKHELEDEFNDMMNHQVEVIKQSKLEFPNLKELNRIRKEKKEIKKESVVVATKIRLTKDDISHIKTEIKETKAKLSTYPKNEEKHERKNSPFINEVNIDEEIEKKKKSIEIKKERIRNKEDRLTRVELVNGIYDHTTPFIFVDIERVCDRIALRKKRVSDMKLKEERANNYVESLKQFLSFIDKQKEEISNDYDCTEWILKLSQCINNVVSIK